MRAGRDREDGRREEDEHGHAAASSSRRGPPPPPAVRPSSPLHNDTPLGRLAQPYAARATTPPTTPACKATRGCGGVERHRARIGAGGQTPAMAGRARGPRLRLHRQVAQPEAVCRRTRRRDGSSIRALHRSLRSRGAPFGAGAPAQQTRFATARRFSPARSRPTARIDRADSNGRAGERRPPGPLRGRCRPPRHRRSRRPRFVWQPGPPASRPASAPPAAAPPENLPGCSGETYGSARGLRARGGARGRAGGRNVGRNRAPSS